MGLDVATLSDVFDGGIAATRCGALAYVSGLTKSNRKLRLSRRELKCSVLQQHRIGVWVCSNEKG